ncbi:hypothetical protein ACSMXM_05015 [Pacificimonas sp. ICDLI1SI03]
MRELRRVDALGQRAAWASGPASIAADVQDDRDDIPAVSVCARWLVPAAHHIAGDVPVAWDELKEV